MFNGVLNTSPIFILKSFQNPLAAVKLFGAVKKF